MFRKILFIFLILPLFCFGQFYNGLQTNFGKNRVQYDDFFWQYFRYTDYDIYFNKGGKELSNYVYLIANKNIADISTKLNLKYDRRIIFIVYNTLSDFKQTNIGLSTADERYNIGGVTTVVDNKVVLYFDGNHINFEKELRKGLTELFINNLLNRTDNLKQLISKSITHEYPVWFIKGLSRYLSESLTPDDFNRLKSLIESGKFRNFNRLTPSESEIAGYAMFAYLNDVFGENILSNILMLTQMTKDVDESFRYVIGLPIKNIIKDVNVFYSEKLLISNPDIINDSLLIKKSKEYIHLLSPTLSPDNNKLLFATNELGKYKVWIKDLITGKKKRILKKGQKLEQITDYSYPVFTWHPSGKLFTIFWESKGKVFMGTYIIETEEFNIREFFYFDKVLSASYSNNGFKIAFSGVKNGQTDIWVHTLASHTNESITQDLADDLYPSYSLDDQAIIFSSNRITNLTKNEEDSLSKTFDLYQYDLTANNGILVNITNTYYDNELLAYELKKNEFTFLNDRNGIFNIYKAERDSTISNVDTIIHYRYFTISKKLTNRSNNILSFYKPPKQNSITGINFSENKYLLWNDNFGINNEAVSFQYTWFKSKQIEKLRQDSIKKHEFDQKKLLLQPFESKNKYDEFVNKDNYVFDIEAYRGEILDSIFNPREQLQVIPSVYQTNFYINQVVNQIDFGFLNESYQPFTGAGVYYIPGINMFFQFGIIDLFEDYRLTGGFRFSGSFDSNELLLSVENLKKQLDKQFIFHRKSVRTIETPTSQTTGSSTMELHKVQDYEIMYILKYPFSEVQSLRFTPTLRYDKDIRLAFDNMYSLEDDIEQKYWAGLKLEYIFDNSIAKGINLYNGTRAKIFAEYYHQLDDLDNYLFVWGLDYRRYLKIHRNIIWANRFAYSGGVGTSPLLYYLGSVDNWINIFSGYDTYNEDVEYDKEENWAYQALATNMRGFNQNIRNGNSFAVLNSEIRFPVFSYFANHPIKNEFINNFQIVGFGDVGTAWYGIIPNEDENAYEYKIIENDPVTVVVDKDFSPIVFGYGFGLRSRVFGYFLRADLAWGVDRGVIMDKIFYLSLSLDF